MKQCRNKLHVDQKRYGSMKGKKSQQSYASQFFSNPAHVALFLKRIQALEESKDK